MDKRARIIEAAADIIVSHGAEHLTLARIAEAIGLTKPGVLHYFSSMEELLAAIVAWCDQRYIEAYQAKIKTTTPHPGRTPRIYMDTVVETYDDGSSKPDAVAAALYATASRTELAGTAYTVSYDQLRQDCYTDGGDIGEALSIIMAFDALCLGSALSHQLTRADRGLIWNNLRQRIQLLEGENHD